MYYLKFLNWFWFKYLEDPAERFLVAFISWFFLLACAGAISGMIGTMTILGYFMIASFAGLFITVIISTIVFMRNRYFDWQEKVFNKLKD
jgi:hypothetical protein